MNSRLDILYTHLDTTITNPYHCHFQSHCVVSMGKNMDSYTKTIVLLISLKILDKQNKQISMDIRVCEKQESGAYCQTLLEKPSI